MGSPKSAPITRLLVTSSFLQKNKLAIVQSPLKKSKITEKKRKKVSVTTVQNPPSILVDSGSYLTGEELVHYQGLVYLVHLAIVDL